MGVRFQGVDTGIGNGALATPMSATVGGVTRSTIALDPPFLGQIGGETFIEYRVPVASNGVVQFSVGIADGAACSDGVTFRVTANEFELWRQHVMPGAWQDVALTLAAFAGKTVALRFISHPGSQNAPWCDWARWSGFALQAPESAALVSVPLALAPGSVVSGFDGDGVLSTSPLAATVSNVSLPGRFTLFTQPGAAVTDGTNLTAVPFGVWGAARGELPRPGSAFNAGNVGSVSSGGVFKNPTIFAHPPNNGTTILGWVLRLPDTPALRFSFAAGIGDGAHSIDGVSFQVRVNGMPYWELNTKSNQWVPGALELGRWHGQTVLLELITDSHEAYDFDWASWADLVLTTSAATCSSTASAAPAVPAFGGSFSVNISAPANCPWSATSAAPWLTVDAGSGTGSGTLRFVAAANVGPARSTTLAVGTTTVTVTQLASTTVTNSPPTVSDIANVGTRRNAPVAVGLAVGDLVGGAAGVVVSAASSNPAVVPSANIVPGGSSANRTLTIVPALNRVGMAIIVVTASARGFSATTTFRVTVHGTGPASDFDADNRSEVGVFRPSTGAWYLLKSSSAFTAGAGYAWGAAGDQPQLGDFDGDGKADITVYRPASAYWFILKSTTN
jgi:hypothetical protein